MAIPKQLILTFIQNMIPSSKKQLRDCMFRETARAAYPGGMSMYGKGIVLAGNKERVSDFFLSPDFNVPRLRTFKEDHKKMCELLSKKIHINTNRPKLNKITVAAKFLDTFLYQLMKFNEYRNLWGKLHLIVDDRLITRLKKCSDKELLEFLRQYPGSPYEASYTQYLSLQDQLKAFIQRIDSKFLKNRIELNFLWAAK